MRVEKSRCNVKTVFLHIFNINLGVFLEAKVVILLQTSIKNRIGDICEFMMKSGPIGDALGKGQVAVQSQIEAKKRSKID